MNSKMLLAFLWAFQNADANLINDSSLKQLRNKLERISQAPKIDSKDWDNIQGKLADILEKNATLNQWYQEAMAELEGIEITASLLPTVEELEQVALPNGKVPTLGFEPSLPKPAPESYEIVNDVVVVKTAAIILKSENPASTSKTLLQRFREIFKGKS